MENQDLLYLIRKIGQANDYTSFLSSVFGIGESEVTLVKVNVVRIDARVLGQQIRDSLSHVDVTLEMIYF